MALPNRNITNVAVERVRIWFSLLIIVVVIFCLRLFYVQIIHYNYYKTAALKDQLKQYQIPATRGLIEAQESNTIVPIVLNQELYTLYADPTLVKNVSSVAAKIAPIIGGQASNLVSLMKTQGTRYVILAH